MANETTPAVTPDIITQYWKAWKGYIIAFVIGLFASGIIGAVVNKSNSDNYNKSAKQTALDLANSQKRANDLESQLSNLNLQFGAYRISVGVDLHDANQLTTNIGAALGTVDELAGILQSIQKGR